jgi:hypothetical protein
MKVNDAIKFLSTLDQELEIIVNVKDRVFNLDSFTQITVKDWCDKYKIECIGDPSKLFVEVLANSQNNVGLPRLPKRNKN